MSQSSQPHFVRDYERLVDKLLEHYPVDEAMSRAVGGGYDLIGQAEADVLQQLGLTAGKRVIDIGCGSGRLSTALGQRFGDSIDYLGIDVVQPMLDYARTKAPSTYRFALCSGLTIPAPDDSADFVAAFSVFTHLRWRETLSYLVDTRRALRPGGLIVFSFLTLPRHWRMLAHHMVGRFLGTHQHFVSYTQRRIIHHWARQSGLQVERFFTNDSFGHFLAVLRRPTE